jgi:hypothetical protein
VRRKKVNALRLVLALVAGIVVGGTLAGAFTGHIVAKSYRNVIAFAVAAVSFGGGIVAASMIPAPLWFVLGDLTVAYFPMAFVAAWLGYRVRSE